MTPVAILYMLYFVIWRNMTKLHHLLWTEPLACKDRVTFYQQDSKLTPCLFVYISWIVFESTEFFLPLLVKITLDTCYTLTYCWQKVAYFLTKFSCSVICVIFLHPPPSSSLLYVYFLTAVGRECLLASCRSLLYDVRRGAASGEGETRWESGPRPGPGPSSPQPHLNCTDKLVVSHESCLLSLVLFSSLWGIQGAWCSCIFRFYILQCLCLCGIKVL